MRDAGAGRVAGAGATAGRSPAEERCDLCHTTIPDDHRHMLHLVERRIVCTCEACWALHSGDPEYRPTGMRTVWLDDFDCSDEVWAEFQIPIGLAFFMRSTVTDGVVAFYPSPAGATESELTLEAWDALVERNPVLEQLEADAEALVVNRMSDPAEYAIVPIDQCYALVGLIKSLWEGISGGSGDRGGWCPSSSRRSGRASCASRRRRDERCRRPGREHRDRDASIPRAAVLDHRGGAHRRSPPRRRWSSRPRSPSPADTRSSRSRSRSQVMIDPARRGYDAETRARLAELFGPPASWAPATSGLFWARVSAAVPGFTGAMPFGIEIPCTYDLEVAAAKYFYAVRDGEIPLSFHFNGNVFFYDADGRLQVVPVPWSRTAQFRMPLAAWQAMIAEHYPGGGWIRLSDETLDRLNRRRAARGQPSFEVSIAELLEEAGEGAD